MFSENLSDLQYPNLISKMLPPGQNAFFKHGLHELLFFIRENSPNEHFRQLNK